MMRTLTLMMALILAGACAQTSAQTYPAKAIRLVVGFAPGGAADFVARALAVTSRLRTPLVPDLPGMEEAGLADYEMSFWYGFFVPAGTRPEIVKKLFGATISALRQPEVKQAFASQGTETAASRSPEEFTAFLAEDAKFWVRLVRESGAKLD